MKKTLMATVLLCAAACAALFAQAGGAACYLI
jgi:hypothetical protein